MLALPVATAVARLELPARPTARSFTAPLAAPATVTEAGAPVGLVPAVDGPERGPEAWLPVVLSLWALGVVLLSVYHLGGWIQARRLTRRGGRAGGRRLAQAGHPGAGERVRRSRAAAARSRPRP